MKSSILLVTCLSLTACATALTEQSASLQQAASCCQAISEFDYRPLPAGKSKIRIDQHSPVFDFEKGRSYFAAFAVPANSSRHFRLKSYFNGMFIGQYFDPVIMVLDEHYQPITIGSLQLEFIQGDMFKDNDAHMLGEFRVDDNARYLVVMTSKFENMAPIARTRPTGYGYMMGNIPVIGTTPGQSIELERSPTGTILIQPLVDR